MARRLAEEDNGFQREIGARYRLADGETLVAAAAYRMGDLADAAAHLRESLAIQVDLDLPVGMVGSLIVAALIAIEAGDPVRGARLAAAAQTIRESTGSSAAPMDVLHLPDPGERARQALGDDGYADAMADGRRLSVGEAVELARIDGLVDRGYRPHRR